MATHCRRSQDQTIFWHPTGLFRWFVLPPKVAAEGFQALPFVSRVVERRMASALWGEAIRGACLLPGSAAVVVPVGGWEVVLAVDEDVVGGVGDGDGGGGLRVAGAR